ncbi:MAG: glycoside hydrolase family 2 protein, partial [Bullifex sp.]
YRTSFQWDGKDRLFIRFIAADWRAVVFLNGKRVCFHEGGYTPFEAELTEEARNGENTLEVKIHDFTDTEPYCRGKQSMKPHGMWYRCQSGIWQSVYLEKRPMEYIKKITSETLDRYSATVTVEATSDGPVTIDFGFTAITAETNSPFQLDIRNLTLWSPDTPKLYPARLRFMNDEAETYFTFRYLSYGDDGRFSLNGKSFYSNGILDQGYSPEGFLTMTYEEMKKDVELIKSLGFNSVRKHIKVEPPVWYRLCDETGLCVWQDMVSGGKPSPIAAMLPAVIQRFRLSDTGNHALFGRKEQKGKDEFLHTAEETINTLKEYGCVILWTVFNEGWGQFDSEKVYKHLRNLDPTRFYDCTSGWHDQKKGELASFHCYFQTYKYRKDRYGRSTVLSEFGGNIYRIKDHVYSDKDFIYRKTESEDEFLERLKLQFENDRKQKDKGLTGSIYTQISDVEEESNGFVTFDREVIKSDIAKLREIISVLND